MIRQAHISDCGRYRWWLRRQWGDGRAVNFIMLNPSTADATEDDPTIRRCIDFAQRWGFGTLIVTNLYAYRATSPKDLFAADDRIGDADAQCKFWSVIEAVARQSQRIIVGWGNHGNRDDRDITIVNRLQKIGQAHKIWALKINKSGAPAHPLYLPKDSPLLEYGRIQFHDLGQF